MRLSGVSATASRKSSAPMMSPGHLKGASSQFRMRPPAARPATAPIASGNRTSNRGAAQPAAMRDAAPASSFTPTGNASSSILKPGEW